MPHPLRVGRPLCPPDPTGNQTCSQLLDDPGQLGNTERNTAEA